MDAFKEYILAASLKAAGQGKIAQMQAFKR
jgi:hypothetical protein